MLMNSQQRSESGSSVGNTRIKMPKTAATTRESCGYGCHSSFRCSPAQISSHSAVLDLSGWSVGADHQLRIHSFNTSGYAMRFEMHRNGGMVQLTFANLTTYGWFGLYLPEANGETYSIRVDRLDNDTEVHFTVEEFTDGMVPFTEPLPRQFWAGLVFW